MTHPANTESGNTNTIERAYIGGLMHLPAERAQEAVNLIEVGDLADPMLRVVYEAIRVLTVNGNSPDPVTVFGAIRDSGELAEAHKLAIAGQTVTRLYAETPTPASVEQYAHMVLEEALRRMIAEAGERLQQIAHTSPLADLRATTVAQFTAVFALGKRHDTVTGNGEVAA